MVPNGVMSLYATAYPVCVGMAEYTVWNRRFPTALITEPTGGVSPALAPQYRRGLQ